MKTITNLFALTLLSIAMLFNLPAMAQGQWPYPSPNAPIASGPLAGTVVNGDLDNPDSQIWVKVNGNIAGPTPHNKMHSSKTNVGAPSFVVPGAAVDVNFNVNKDMNRYTLVSYSVDRTTGLRTLFDYQSNLYNDGKPVQGNSNQQLVKVPYNCDWEIYLVKGGIESNTVPAGSPVGSFMASTGNPATNGTTSIITGPQGNPYAYKADGVTLRTTAPASVGGNRILDYSYGSGADLVHCETCPQITNGNGVLDIFPNDDDQIYFRLIEIIEKATTKELIFSVINTTNTKDALYADYDYIGDVLFSNILPAHHPRNNTPYQFRYNYQSGPQITGYTIGGAVPAGLSYGPKDAFVFDQRNNHNNLNYGTYQSELFMFEVTNAVYSDLGAPNAPQAEICAELSSKHPEPHKTLHPVFCADIDFCGPTEECPPPVVDACTYTDCCVSMTFLGSPGGSAPEFTRILFDLAYLDESGCNLGEIDEITFTFSQASAADEALIALIQEFNPGVSDYNFSVSGKTVTFEPKAGYTVSQDFFAFDVPNALITSPAGQEILVTMSSGANSISHPFILDVTTDVNGQVNPECGVIVTLPVELTTFTGKATNEGIALNWKTASEKNNDRFEIERSTDGKNFEKVGTLKGKGTTSAASSYNFTDKHALKGLNYYRLRQVDFDGAHAFSQIIKVNSEKGATVLGVQLIPNPCADQNCSVMLQGVDTSKPLTVEMRDLTGRLIFSQQVAADQQSFNLPKGEYGKGIYILSAKNGQSFTYQRVIIQ